MKTPLEKVTRRRHRRHGQEVLVRIHHLHPDLYVQSLNATPGPEIALLFLFFPFFLDTQVWQCLCPFSSSRFVIVVKLGSVGAALVIESAKFGRSRLEIPESTCYVKQTTGRTTAGGLSLVDERSLVANQSASSHRSGAP